MLTTTVVEFVLPCTTGASLNLPLLLPSDFRHIRGKVYVSNPQLIVS